MQYGKTDGRMFYHLVQSFSPDEKITPDLAHKIAIEFAHQQFKCYEVLIGTHIDKGHIHSHFVINSVNAETGKKYHPDNNEIQRLRNASDELCLKYGLSIITNPSKNPVKQMSPREYRAAIKCESWKVILAIAIDDTMKYAKSKKDFINLMKQKGYEVKWTDERKYITYTCPNNMKCRDIKLHDEKYLKGNMEYEFERRKKVMGRYEGLNENSTDTTKLYDSNRAELERNNRLPEDSNIIDEINIGQTADNGYGLADERYDSRAERSDFRQFIQDRNSNGGFQAEHCIDSNNLQYGCEEHSEFNRITGWESEYEFFRELISREAESESISERTEITELDTTQHTNSVNDSFYLLGNLATIISNQRKFHRKSVKLSRKEMEKRLAHGQRISNEEYNEVDEQDMTM